MLSESHVADVELLQWLDRELETTPDPAIERHLGTCPRCRARRDQLAAASADASALYPDSRADDRQPAGRARLMSAMTAATEASRWRISASSSRSIRWIAAAAIAATALMATRQPAALWTMVDGNQRLVLAGMLPVSSLTPGATLAATARELCEGRTPARRILPASMRQQVLREYGMEHVPSGEYELDYLITPELGGAPHARNLWPQRYASATWNARVKDQLEELLPRLVCAGQLNLQEAQFDMATDWIAAYRKYFHTTEPLHSLAGAADDDAPLLFDERPTASPGHPAVRLVMTTAAWR